MQNLGCQHVNVYLVAWEVIDPKDVKPESSASVLKRYFYFLFFLKKNSWGGAYGFTVLSFCKFLCRRSHVLAENTLITKDAIFNSFEVSIPKDTTPSFQSDGLAVTYSLDFHFGVSRSGRKEVAETQWSLPIVLTP